MAASIDHDVRVKLTFKQLNTEPSWFCVSFQQCKCVSDVEKRIISKFDLPNKCVKLILSDCRIPPWENSRILRDNDSILVLPNDDTITTEIVPAHIELVEHVEITKIKKKKKKSRDSEVPDELSIVCSATADSDHAERNLKKRKHEILDILNSMELEQQSQQMVPEQVNDEGVAKKKQRANSSDTNEDHHQTETNDESGDKKKRKRKRKRKNKNEQSTSDLKSDANDSVVMRPVKNKVIKINLPYSKRPLGIHRTFSDEEDKSKQKNNHETTTSNEIENDRAAFTPPIHDTPPNSEDHRAHNDSSDFKFGKNPRDKRLKWGAGVTSSNDIPARENHENRSIPPCTMNESKLTNGAVVYTRQRTPRGRTTVIPLTTEPSSNGDTHGSDPSLHSHTQSEMVPVVSKKNVTTVGKVNCKYSEFPDVAGPPRKGDKIAYKIIELTSSCTPEVSNYKEAKVMSYDPITTMVELHILTADLHPSSPNRFSMDSEITGVEDITDKITVELGSLLEAKLLTV